MAIDDPSLPPENAQQVAEYLRAADLAFERQHLDDAMTLYWSVSASNQWPDTNTAHHAYARIGSILVARGNSEEAYRWFQAAGPAGADMLRVLDAQTPDTAVDPTVIPQTPEQLSRYINAAWSAEQNQDHATFDALVARILESGETMPGQRSEMALMMAKSLLARGDYANAQEWAQHSLAESSGTTGDEAREVISKAADELTLLQPDPRDVTYGFELSAAMMQFE